MKKLLTAIAFFGAIITYGQGLVTPRQSPQAELKQTIGLTEITINYSRPNVVRNGRDRTGSIWGNQVPYGFQKINFGSKEEIPWRAGANENTIISFSTPVKIGSKDIPAGSYGLHMAIQEDNTATIILSSNTSSWGSFYYTPKEDILRHKVTMEKAELTKTLTYELVDFGNDFGLFALTWEKKRIPFRIDVNTHEVALASFRDQLRGPVGFSWRGPFSAAQYCANNNINHEEALGWADQAISSNKGYNTLVLKGTLLYQKGNQEDALKLSDEAAQIANINELNSLGYTMLQMERNDKALEYFKLNVKRNPKDANVYDSLGEAYKISGDKSNAIKSFKKALALDPPANVAANSKKHLEDLGVAVD